MTAPKLVVAVISHSWDPTTGAGRCAMELREALRASPSLQLVVDDSEAGSPASSRTSRILQKLRRGVRIWHLLRRDGVDIVVVNTTVQSSIVVAARLAGVRIVWWCHEAGSSLDSPIMRWRLRLYRTLSHRTVVVTRAVPSRAPRPVLIRNQVSTPTPELERPLRRPVLLVLGRKGWRKGTDLLPTLLVADALPDAELWLVGDDEPREGAELDAVRRDLTASWGDRLRWIDAVRDTSPFLHTASVLLLPSRAEARPRVVEEALAHGVPVVCSPLPGIEDIRETIAEPRYIRTVPLDEPWTSAVLEVVEQGRAGHSLITPYTDQQFRDAWLALLGELAEAEPIGHPNARA